MRTFLLCAVFVLLMVASGALAQEPAFELRDSLDATLLTVTADGRVGVRATAADTTFNLQAGLLETYALRLTDDAGGVLFAAATDGSLIIPTGAADGRVLTSDDSGNATWKRFSEGLWTKETTGYISYDGQAALNRIDFDTTFALQANSGDSYVLRMWDSSGVDLFGVRSGGRVEMTNRAGINWTDSIATLAVRANASDSYLFWGKDSAGTTRFSVATDGSLRIPTGAVDGHVLTSDGTGIATWEAPPQSPWYLFLGGVIRYDGSIGVNWAHTAVTLWLRAESGDTDLVRAEDSSANTVFRVRTGGRVDMTNRAGINNTNTNSTLTVRANGDDARALLTEDSAGNNLFYVETDGGIYAPLLPFGDHGNMQYNASTGRFFYDNSSRRYKEQITPLTDDFARILEAQPMTYVRPGAPDRWEIGYIAEDFADLGLEILLLRDDEGLPEAINYDKIPLYLVEVAKQQAERIDELEQLVEEQRRLLDRLAQRLDAVEAQ